MSLIDRLVGRVLIILFCLGVLIPFAALILAAINPPGTPVGGLTLPTHPTFESFVQAWTTAGFGKLLFNSSFVCVLVVPLALFCATLSGYAFATMRFRGSAVLFAFLLLGMTLPFDAAVVPLYYKPVRGGSHGQAGCARPRTRGPIHAVRRVLDASTVPCASAGVARGRTDRRCD